MNNIKMTSVFIFTIFLSVFACVGCADDAAPDAEEVDLGDVVGDEDMVDGEDAADDEGTADDADVDEDADEDPDVDDAAEDDATSCLEAPASNRDAEIFLSGDAFEPLEGGDLVDGIYELHAVAVHFDGDFADRVEDIADAGSSGSIHIQGGFVAVRSFAAVSFTETGAEEPTGPFEYDISVSGSYTTDGSEISFAAEDCEGAEVRPDFLAAPESIFYGTGDGELSLLVAFTETEIAAALPIFEDRLAGKEGSIKLLMSFSLVE